MKFNNLKNFQQLAILADLAGIMNTDEDLEDYVPLGHSKPIDTSVYGLSKGVGFYKLGSSFYAYLGNPSEGEVRVNFHRESADETHCNPNFKQDISVDDGITVGRFGIGTDMVFASADVKHNLERVIEFLDAFENILNTNTHLNTIIKQTYTAFPLAEQISEPFLDYIYVNDAVAGLLGETRDRLVESTPLFYHENTPSPADYNISTCERFGLRIFHNRAIEDQSAQVFTVGLGHRGDDTVFVGYYIPATDTYTLMGGFAPTYDGDPQSFVTRLKEDIRKIVIDHPNRELVINKLNAFLDELQ